MFKLLIVILLSMLLSSSVMTSDHPSSGMVTETVRSHPLASAPEDSSVRLYAVSPSQGIFHSAVLEIGQQQRRTFQWSGLAEISAAPQLYYRDVNEDGVREVIVILTRASGTGVELQEMHIVNAQTMEEYAVESAANAVSQRIHSSVELRDHNRQVHITVTINGTTHTMDPKASVFYDDPAHFTKHLDFSSVVIYDAEQSPLQATVSGSVSPSEFVGDLDLKYVYEQGQFRVGSIKFEASSPF
ncbi:copper amine oxidase [Paenibacillus jamilae]|uniref:hypothetical protein n=1 Tax=Paenibacillus jamilae TaxID=114136 RepID=UPI0007AB67EB|nr:hypothetical protein [Paenibacillus jamilae]KZE63577.1 copper amine oxidase [Paenibacillus jamilae]